MLNIVLLIVGLVLLIIFFKWFWMDSALNSYKFTDEMEHDPHTSSSNKSEHTDTNQPNKFKKIS